MVLRAGPAKLLQLNHRKLIGFVLSIPPANLPGVPQEMKDLVRANEDYRLVQAEQLVKSQQALPLSACTRITAILCGLATGGRYRPCTITLPVERPRVPPHRPWKRAGNLYTDPIRFLFNRRIPAASVGSIFPAATKVYSQPRQPRRIPFGKQLPQSYHSGTVLPDLTIHEPAHILSLQL